MDNASVSKGAFPYKGKYKIGSKKVRPPSPEYCDEPWYAAYKKCWLIIEKAAKDIRSNMFEQILKDLQSFVSKVKDKPIDSFESEIPTAILLTGVNVPDHAALFKIVVSKLEPLSKHVAVVWSRDSNNLKTLMDETIYQLMIKTEMEDVPEIKKSQCNMRLLKLWYQEYCEPGEPLVIIITDFESSSTTVLHDFIQILSAYSDTIKFILIFGVATTLHAIHRSLSYDVTSKMKVQVFHMETQINILADVLKSTVFTPDIPFKLTGRAFQLLTDIFLFYDFSVENFLQNFKMCMIQHFYGNNVNALCCKRGNITKRISTLSEEDITEIKKIPSIEKYMKKLQKDNNDVNTEAASFKEILTKLLNQFHAYMEQFLIILKCLHCLTSTLPNAPLGKQFREYYSKAVYINNITESQEYKESLQLLGFLSKKELIEKLESVLRIAENTEDPAIQEFRGNLQSRIKIIETASLEIAAVSSDIVSADEKLSRVQLKEKLLKMSQMQSRSPYKQAQLDLISYLDQKVFPVYLVNPNEIPANEIFCFSDGNLAKQHIRGSLRAAIHTGLNDPQVYLNCECCKLEDDEAIPSTLPDLSIIYKLHLESRKLINMYDWLQAFLIIVDPNSESAEQRDVDPKLQARFTQAVAELEFLGFIKTSRKKVDHVKRLT